MHSKARVASAVIALSLLLAASGWAADGTAPQSAPPAGATYVGSETCKGCHEDTPAGLFKHFQKNPHRQALLQGAAKEAQGCESCHGPGSAHVEGGGDKSKIFSFTSNPRTSQNKQCLTCHGVSAEHGAFLASKHGRSDVGCTSCHSVHAPEVQPALLRQTSPQLCYTCHTEVRAEFVRPFRHRVNERLISCNDCHNPHGGQIGRQLRVSASTDAQVCTSCHQDKLGPFTFEHVPVRTEGCTVCHQPHGSTTPRMLKRATVNVLCLQCHTRTLNSSPTVLSPAPEGPVHNQQQRYVSCTVCHVFVHGSNSSAVFFKP